MAINKGTLAKKIDGVMEYIYPKTSADQVVTDPTRNTRLPETLGGKANAPSFIETVLLASNWVEGTIYNEVTPNGSENPSTSGWYELSNDTYTASSDTTVNNNKTYYARGSKYTYQLPYHNNYRVTVNASKYATLQEFFTFVNGMIVGDSDNNILTALGSLPGINIHVLLEVSKIAENPSASDTYVEPNS